MTRDGTASRATTATATVAGVEPGEPLLSLEHVSAGYGPFRAIFDVSFTLNAGEAIALLGSNGAGKTTIARLCSGLIAPTSGRVLLGGDDIGGRPANRIARLGVTQAPEGRSVFASLTVAENLALGFRATVGAKGVPGALDAAYALFPRLGDRRSQLAGSLSGGEQRMLSLARVLVHPPKVLIVDELSLGLAPIIVEEVYRNLATVKAKGTALLIVEQHVEHALALADQVVVLTRGEVSYDGPVLSLEQLTEHLLPTAVPEPLASELESG